MVIVDQTKELVTTWSQPVHIENVDALRSHLQQPLAQNEKVPISQEGFNALCVPYSEESRWSSLTAQELSTLFQVGTVDRASAIKRRFMTAITAVPPLFSTEDGFHYTYDNNIRENVKFILSNTNDQRNSNNRTSTGPKRPDFSLLINNYCLFRGEEKGGLSTGKPEDELTSKITCWEYGPLPFVLGLLQFYCHLTGSLCLCNRISYKSHNTQLCCNYSPTFYQYTPLQLQPQDQGG